MNAKLAVSFILLALFQTIQGCLFRPSRPSPTPAPTPPPPAPTPPPPPPPSSCKCGEPQGSRNRIVGGQPATKNEYPWTVALVRNGQTKPFCGGTLLSSKTILTAAHCKVYQNFQIKVHVGEHDVTKNDGEQKIRVSSFTQHPQYNSGTTDNDFAIIQLSRDVTFSNTIMPICLPDSNTNYDSRVSTVVGWGTISSGSSSSPNTPYEVDVSTITNTACTTNTLYNPGEITGNMICAREAGKDSCQGLVILLEHIYLVYIFRRFRWSFDHQGEQLLLSDRSCFLGYWMCSVECSGCLLKGDQSTGMD